MCQGQSLCFHVKIMYFLEVAFEDCRDADPKYCAAQKSRCFWNSKVMSKKCKLTCNMCSPLTNCFDKNSYCPKWKESGHCDVGSIYRAWTLENCKFTCTHCGKILPTTKPPPPQVCRDADPKFCAAQKSNCLWNSKVMSVKCKSTCNMCSSSIKCFDKNSYCPQWKKQGFCDNGSRVFMMETCKYTCTGC